MIALFVLLTILKTGNALVAFCPVHRRPSLTWTTSAPSQSLSMGLLDSISSFLQEREGDFVKLQDTDQVIGPGPLLLLYNVNAPGIDKDEYMDMVSDGAPKATESGVIVSHMSYRDDAILDMPLLDALEQIARDKGVVAKSSSVEEEPVVEKEKSCPVLFFSGFCNEEMMATYNIVGKEIYEESGGSLTPACAKYVERAMSKPLRQVLNEIAGDHKEAMSAE